MRWLPPQAGFLGDENRWTGTLEGVRAAVVPFPLEATVCYGGGTAGGPQALIEASHQVETWDEELELDLGAAPGIATLAPLSVEGGLSASLDCLRAALGDLLERGIFPLTLGGEHSLTPAAVEAAAARFGPLSVLCLDAHADLRERYQGTPRSHACAMRRCLDLPGVTVASVGVRSLSRAEAEYAAAHPDTVRLFLARGRRWTAEEVIGALQETVYLSLDVDALDSSLMPSTGTPEPGGLGWEETLDLLRAVFAQRRVVAADLVELAPCEGLHAPTFLAARLATKILAYQARSSS